MCWHGTCWYFKTLQGGGDTEKVSLHDDDEMMMVMMMGMRRARVVVTPIKVSHIGTGSRWADWEGKQGWGVECGGCSGV